MWEMPYYDIMLLYKRFVKHVEEENERDNETKAQYEEQYQQPQAQMPQIPKMPDFNNVAKGMVNNAMGNIPKIF